MVIEGSRSGAGSGSIPLTDGSGSGSGRPKNMWIRIRIRNTVLTANSSKEKFYISTECTYELIIFFLTIQSIPTQCLNFLNVRYHRLAKCKLQVTGSCPIPYKLADSWYLFCFSKSRPAGTVLYILYCTVPLKVALQNLWLLDKQN